MVDADAVAQAQPAPDPGAPAIRVVDLNRSRYKVPETARRRRFWYEDGAWINGGDSAGVVGFVFAGWLADQGLHPPDGEYDQEFGLGVYDDARRRLGFEDDVGSGATVLAAAGVLHERGILEVLCRCRSAETVAKAVLERAPVVIGIPWYESMYVPRRVDARTEVVSFDPDSTVLGGHAVMLNGVDLDLTIGGVTGFFRLKNSWGRGWGYRGRCFISVADVDALVRAGGEAYLPITTASAREGARPSPVPWSESDGESAPKVSVRSLAGFVSDVPSGEDCLGIQREIDALCSVITAREVSPPLSIGLFGDWGSGKSFFMQLMQKGIAELSRQAELGETVEYCSHVRQVVFNAWHYSDANLWASLATHIFQELGQPPPDEAPGAYETMLRELSTSKALRADAEAEHETASQRVAELETQLQAAQEQREETARELISLGEGVAGRVARDPEVRAAVGELLQPLGRDVGEWLRGGEDFVGDLASLSGRLREAGRLLWRHRMPALAWSAGIAVAAAVAWLVVRNLGSELRAVTVAAAALGEFLAVIRKPLHTVSSTATSLQRLADRTVDAAEHERDAKLVTLREDLRVQGELEVDRRRALESAQERVVAAEARIADVTSGRELQRYLAERATSSDYSRYLGLIALVRNDFERLAQLLDVTESARSAGLPPRDSLPPIERIVLYIDDLDRCPPQKVVDVLQAVHLLLAFDLFVVVVGVDFHWLFSSLRLHYSEPLGGERASDGESDDQWRTTPQNYLEKIFQIPYCLRPMDRAGFAALVAQLTTVTAAPPRSGEGHGDADDHAREHEHEHEVKPADGDFAMGAMGGVRPERIPIEMHPERLSFEPAEREFMTELADMVPTPRAAKRLVNIYRLIRASLDEVDLLDFLDEYQRVGDYRAVLVLLGILIGYPQHANRLFQALLEGDDRDWWALLQRTVPVDDDGPVGFWIAIARVRATLGDDVSAEAFRLWAQPVSRFSFHTARLGGALTTS